VVEIKWEEDEKKKEKEWTLRENVGELAVTAVVVFGFECFVLKLTGRLLAFPAAASFFPSLSTLCETTHTSRRDATLRYT
jgi:hypothetical protein